MAAMPRPTRARSPNLGVVDYTLAKRALIRSFHRGLTSRLEICDAHPELLRAAKYLARHASRPCPGCGPTRRGLLHRRSLHELLLEAPHGGVPRPHPRLSPQPFLHE